MLLKKEMTNQNIFHDKCKSNYKFNFLEDQTLFKSKSNNMDALTRLNVHASLLEDMISQEKLYRVSRYMTMALIPKKEDEPMDTSVSPTDDGSSTTPPSTHLTPEQDLKANIQAAILAGQLQDVVVPFASSSALVFSSPKK